MILLVIAKLFSIKEGKIPHSEMIVWTFIPLVYLLSLLYSRDFQKGWYDWVKMSPVLVLPLFYNLFQNEINQNRWWWKLYIGGIALQGVFHLLFNWYNISLHWKRESFPISLFYFKDQQSWIIWSGILIACIALQKMSHRKVAVGILLLYLNYFGLVHIAGSAVIFYFLMEVFYWKTTLKSILVDILFICGLHFVSFQCFESFRNGLSQLGAFISTGFTEIKYSYNQFNSHPMNGVGLGQFIHAMWNEYNVHQVSMPEKYKFQFFHGLVSTGLVFFLPVVLVFRKYEKSMILIRMVGLYTLIILFLFSPFQSQVSAMAYILPLFCAHCVHPTSTITAG